MLIDNQLVFDPPGTLLTVSAVSSQVIDLGLPNGGIGGTQGRDLGISNRLFLVVTPQGLFTAAGDATLQIAIQGAPDNGSGAPGTYATLAQSKVYSLAELNNGSFLFPIGMPDTLLDSGPARFLQLDYTVGTGPFTGGGVQSFLNIGRPDDRIYNDNIDVSNI